MIGCTAPSCCGEWQNPGLLPHALLGKWILRLRFATRRMTFLWGSPARNLVDLIMTCIEHPAAANETFLAGAGEDLSTTELLRRMGKALGKPARLVPVPMAVLESGAKLVGKPALSQRLCGSLQVDITKARDLLDWQPPVTVDEALRETARDFPGTQTGEF